MFFFQHCTDLHQKYYLIKRLCGWKDADWLEGMLQLLTSAAVETRPGCTAVKRQRVARALCLDVCSHAHQSRAVAVDDQRSVVDDQNVTAARRRPTCISRRTLVDRYHRHSQPELRLNLNTYIHHIHWVDTRSWLSPQLDLEENDRPYCPRGGTAGGPDPRGWVDLWLVMQIQLLCQVGGVPRSPRPAEFLDP